LIKLLQADNFYKQEDISLIYSVVSSLQFIEKEHGFEVDQFNFTIPGLDPIFSKFVGEEVTVDEENSGIFRKPNLRIHFEGFDSFQEWVFILALEPTTFNLYHHLTGAKNALEEYRFDYNNLLEWEYHTNILLEPNQGIIFRPWLFHSLTHERLIQIYRLKERENGKDRI
jgi:hypothetical protein